MNVYLNGSYCSLVHYFLPYYLFIMNLQSSESCLTHSIKHVSLHEVIILTAYIQSRGHDLLTLSQRITHKCMVEYLNNLILLLWIYYQGNIFLIFSSNSEAKVSKLLENLEKTCLFVTHSCKCVMNN